VPNPDRNNKKTSTTDEDCPPQENCVEKWVEKTLHVSARASAGAIEIPVAFKKLVCEGDLEEDPQMDCDELLKALKGSIDEGGVPGMMGLSNTILQNLAKQKVARSGNPTTNPDWCDDCEERLIKASAYVTEQPAPGSKPFKVKVKMLVCETDADPTIDCEEVLRALGAGLRAKRKARTLNGLSESSRYTGTNVPPPQSTKTASNSGGEFDKEANRIDPTREQAQQAGIPWWAWVMIGSAAYYASRKL
jgi:hypothetical protein